MEAYSDYLKNLFDLRWRPTWSGQSAGGLFNGAWVERVEETLFWLAYSRVKSYLEYFERPIRGWRPTSFDLCTGESLFKLFLRGRSAGGGLLGVASHGWNMNGAGVERVEESLF